SPALEPLRGAVREGRVSALTHALASAELARVLEFPQLQRYLTDARLVLEAYRAGTTMTGIEPGLLIEEGSLPKGFPRCRDPDDDKFLALAFHAKADALVSKDREVLKLRKRVKPFGFVILTVPEMLDAINPADPNPSLREGIL